MLEIGNKWHYVSGNDTCQSILSEFDLTKAQFYDWNPATGANCTNLWFEVDVCVGVPGKYSLFSAPKSTRSNF